MDRLTFQNLLNNSTNEQLYNIYNQANDKYHNTGENTGLTDEQFDTLKDKILLYNPSIQNMVGHKLRNQDNKIKLPNKLMSMNKGTTLKCLDKWLSSIDIHDEQLFIMESKLDGLTGNLVINDNKYYFYTRGNGEYGSDISYLVKYIKNIPKNVTTNMNIRGELIIDKNIFESKYANDFANPRNMTSGCINAKSFKQGIVDIEFIAYELIGENNQCRKPTEQLSILKQHGFNCVQFKMCKLNKINIQEEAKNTLIDFKNKNYDIDGVIIQADIPYIRAVDKNPSYAIAYKMTLDSNITTTKVQSVVWNTSRNKLIKPVLVVEPRYLNGVTITNVTAYNAKYINDNFISEGTIIEITRSGDVIPKTVRVVDKINNDIDMPTHIKWKWNDTKVDIINIDENDDTSSIKTIYYFFEQLNCKNIGLKTIEKLYFNGFDTILKILNIKPGDITTKNIKGFDSLSEKRIIDSIKYNVITDTGICKLLNATCVFGHGMGIKKIELLINTLPEILSETTDKTTLYSKIHSIKGFSKTTTNKIIDNLDNMLSVISDFGKLINITYNTPQHISDNKTFVLSGFRSDVVKNKLLSQGYSYTETLNKNTTLLVISDKCINKPDSSKVKKAKGYGIKILFENQI